MQSFAKDVLQFVSSIEHLPGGAYSRLVRFFRNYFETVLGAGFYEVQLDGVKATAEGGDREGLSTDTDWSNASEQVTPVRTISGEYRGQTTYAYAEGVNLWVTAKNKGPLKDVTHADHFVDSWSNRKNIPLYWNYSEEEKGLIARTSIILPLRHPGSGSQFGFMNLEFANHFLPRPEAMKELQDIAQAVAIILHLRGTRKHRVSRIDESIADINRRLESKHYPSPFLRPRLFLAYAKGTDQQVLSIVRSEIRNFEHVIQKVDWNADMKKPGPINKQIDTQIMESAFGVCIVSEPSRNVVPSRKIQKSEKLPRYEDNPNVLIEAGMMHAFEISSAPMSGWILIRERSSPPIPFDFVVHRRIEIPRDKNDNLNKDQFADELKSRLEAMISPPRDREV